MIVGFSGHLLPEDFLEARAALHPEALDFQRAVNALRGNMQGLGPASSVRAVFDVALVPLAALLGFEVLGTRRSSDFSTSAVGYGDHASVLLMACGWSASLDALWREAVTRAAEAGAAWCLVTNGRVVRLVRAGRLFSRRYAEFDLDALAEEPRSSAAAWLVLKAHTLAAPPSSPHGIELLLEAAERHAAGVRQSLRGGVLSATTEILRALAARGRREPVNEVFEQALTLVYRLVFLLFAEARVLVPLWHPVYRASYSVEALRERALARRSRGLWDALRAMTRLAHAGCRVGTLRVTPFNGRLFAPARTPLAERPGLDDEAARAAILAVSTRVARDGESRERVMYRDLGVEQLGAVYETLLEYAPHVEPGGSARAPTVLLRAGSDTRKATGSFYTPRAIASYVIRDTLAPLVSGATPERILGLRVLDPSMGSGAFLVGACRFLADAYVTALVEHGRCHHADIGPGERASIRRTIAERCLVGVDLNPTAVQLARLSLWLATLAADRPLTFLDHHLRVGDSLAGTWLARLHHAPTRRRTSGTPPLLEQMGIDEIMRDVLPVRQSLEQAPNDTAAQVRAKERALDALASEGSPLARWKQVADAWCAAWLATPAVPAAAFGAVRDHLLAGRRSLPDATMQHLWSRIANASLTRRLFHWELEFPEVFFDAHGRRRADAGFDAVLGNPPWDMVRADAGDDRAGQRASSSTLVRFARDSGVYDVRAGGQANRYQLFLERAVALTRPGGRIGMIVPFGLLSDAGSAALRRWLFSRCQVDRLVGFDNRAAVFPVHRSLRFVLLSATAGGESDEILCRFGESDASALDGAGAPDTRAPASWFPVRVNLPLLRRLSGDSLAVPDVRSPLDLALAERAAAMYLPLGHVRGWHARFARELNATEDRDCLRERPPGWPVLEGKHIVPFRADATTVRWHVDEREVRQRLGARAGRLRLAYRDVAGAANRITLIAAVLPARSASTHTLFCLQPGLPARAHHFLCAILNSVVLNFLARLWVGTHVTTAIVERLPVPTRDEAGDAFETLADLAFSLSHAPDVRKEARVHAAVARLYGWRRTDLEVVLGRFPLVPDAEKAAVLEAFARTG